MAEPKTKSNQALARLYSTVKRKETVFDLETKIYWRYNGFIWEPLDGDELTDDLATFVEKNDTDNRFTMTKIGDIAQQCRRFSRKIKRLDDKWLSFTDCMIDPTTFERGDHKPENIATIHIDYDYDKLKECKMPMFRKYLDMTCLDDETKTYDFGMEMQLQEMAGYLLTPEITEKCFILYGNGGTGKSVYLDILRKLISDERCHSANLSSLTTKDFQLAALIAKRANIVDEEESINSDISFLKRLVSGNPITTRQLYGRPFTFRPRTKLYFGSNRFPRLDGFDFAVQRRFLIVMFENRISRENKIINLADRIKEAGEIPAIVHWALQGLQRLRRNNFTFTETNRSKKAMEEFKMSSSSVAEYLLDNWRPEENQKAPAKEIYEQYCEWCKSNGRKPVSMNRFGREATDVLGPSKKIKINGISVVGYQAVPKIDSLSEDEQISF